MEPELILNIKIIISTLGRILHMYIQTGNGYLEVDIEIKKLLIQFSLMLMKLD